MWPCAVVCNVDRVLLQVDDWASPSLPGTFNDMMCSGNINDEDKKELHGRVQT